LCAGLVAVPGSIGAGADRITPDAVVQSVVWLDTNQNGTRDREEAGLADVQVSLLDCDGAFLAATRTDQRGVYRFDVPNGCYRVRVARGPQQKFCPAGLGFDRSRDSDVDPATGVSAPITVDALTAGAGADAGLVDTRRRELGDRVWEDLDADGVQDVGEPGIAGVSVALLDCAGRAVTDERGAARQATTDADGYFLFGDMPTGCYRVAVNIDDAWSFTAHGVALESLDSDIRPDLGTSDAVQLDASGARFDVDAGLYRTARVGDWVWFDDNADGVQNVGESGVAGIEVLLLTADGVPTGDVVKTDENGYFEFAGLVPGDYRVQYVVPAPYRIGERNQGIDIQLDSNANALGTTRVIPVRSGGARMDIDLGLFAASRWTLRLRN
ncbi:MAG: SdrD B-like domain-containing protein, partial [Pseudomonadota bacterium]